MIRAFLIALCLAAPAAGADVPSRLEQAFRSWVDEVDADAAVMSISKAGVLVRDVAVGMAADTPVELASLSKAVTALCVAHLMETDVWDDGTTSYGVLGYGLKGLNVAALMTHSAGLGPDQTQTLMPLWLDTPDDRVALAARTALERGGQSATSEIYTYNNENYAVLGAMIAAQTGETYADFCQREVLDVAGVTSARLSPRSGGMAAWGGWQMSVQDYAKLLHWGFGPDGKIGQDPQRWPQAAIGGGAFYGTGMIQRAFGGSMNYWHFGALCFPGRMNIGSYAVSWMAQWSVVVAYDRCVDWDAMIKLDKVLSQAVFQ